MGSSYFGEPNLGNERSAGSSRKGKKSNSDKPKQPQRGLGVAQLEKIRLHSQMGSSNYLPSLHGPYPTNLTQEDMRLQRGYSSTPTSSSFSYTSSATPSYGFHGHHNNMMGIGELDQRGNIRYGDSHPSSTTARWNPGSGMLGPQQFAQHGMESQFLNLQVEESQKNRRKKDRSIGSSSQNSETGDTEEIDLELRL